MWDRRLRSWPNRAGGERYVGAFTSRAHARLVMVLLTCIVEAWNDGSLPRVRHWQLQPCVRGGCGRQDLTRPWCAAGRRVCDGQPAR